MDATHRDFDGYGPLCLCGACDEANETPTLGAIPAHREPETPRLHPEQTSIQAGYDGTLYYTRHCDTHHWRTRTIDHMGDLRSCPGCAAELEMLADGGRARYLAGVEPLTWRLVEERR